MHRLEKVFALKMETVIESVLGKGTLAQEQLTYVKYFFLLIVTLITIQLSRIIMPKIFSAMGTKHSTTSAGPPPMSALFPKWGVSIKFLIHFLNSPKMKQPMH